MGPADVELLLNLHGTLVSIFPRGEGFQLDLAVDAGGDAAQILVAELQVIIPGSVCQTLEQCGEFRGGAFLTHGFVSAELSKLYLCCGLIVEVAEAGPEGGGKSGDTTYETLTPNLGAT
ncbi:hypothetical protein IEO21_10950 [Rhodonia placenta]|uniref:Uncharacterized protein n=1 Tax=Rhodonia placenta TaxID=104341 RepID=A0A8H7NRI3_9APHY|nr:hypothetical protein IEO21_10950 [Postia placenta]